MSDKETTSQDVDQDRVATHLLPVESTASNDMEILKLENYQITDSAEDGTPAKQMLN